MAKFILISYTFKILMADNNLFDRPFIGYDGSNACHHLLTVFARMHPKF